MNKHGFTPDELLDMKKDIKQKVDFFYEITKWTDEDYKQYEVLLKNWKDSFEQYDQKKITSKQKGDALENIVNFIINKSFFLEVYNNVRTSTHEIDQFITFSNYWFQARHQYQLSQELTSISGNYFLGECKNYKEGISTTWVGKFNTLLDVCGNCKLGIIFSYKGLKGTENSWNSAYGLTKVIYRMGKDGEKRYILNFDKNDFENLKDKNTNIFKIINSKKLALESGSKSSYFYEHHEQEDAMSKIFNDFQLKL